ncbi:MAG: phosphate acyltransferase PlsX [Bacteroidetes bacterium]|nr:phosphate acyltransferase PlsX [Bacteroidota bacterium]
MRIVVDAMGGDFAPKNVILGTLEAIKETDSRFHIILTGDQDAIKQELTEAGAPEGLPITIHHTSQVISMEDSAATAVKGKPDSSIVVGLGLCAKGHADGFLSAGNTGAVMAASTYILGRIPGVSRPTISAFFPRRPQGHNCILDVGANVDCKPEHLVQFALMGSIFMREMFGVENPKIGTLSIGEEETKGNELTKEVHKLLKASKMNFVGNVEGRDLFTDQADVYVCDGYTGNIILKFAESIGHFIGHQLKKQMAGMNLPVEQQMLVGGVMKKTMQSFDYEEFGGVPLLGVNGVSIIGHGGSTPKAVKNMILEAEKMVNLGVNKKIQDAIAQMNNA